MDFVGQKLAEKIFQWIIIFFGFFGLVAGFIKQDFHVTAFCVGAGFVVSCLICGPDWGYFNKNPIKWAEPKPVADNSTPVAQKAQKKR